MKKLFIFLTLMALQFNFAQTDKKISGFYNLRGGAHYIKPNHTFVILAYATIIVGTWRVLENDIVELTPNYEKKPFTIYSRFNEKIKSGCKFMLSNGL